MKRQSAERAPRAVALGRKNFLFAGSNCGGERAAAMYTLIGTAKLNGIDPELYSPHRAGADRRSPHQPHPGSPALEPRRVTSGPLFPGRLDTLIRRPPKTNGHLMTHSTSPSRGPQRHSAYAYGPPGPCVGSKQTGQNWHGAASDLLKIYETADPAGDRRLDKLDQD
ncbi:MAG: family transposase [Edaphobacter sp.]|nr:family transposase [Edaphobacter sp.]